MDKNHFFFYLIILFLGGIERGRAQDVEDSVLDQDQLTGGGFLLYGFGRNGILFRRLLHLRCLLSDFQEVYASHH